MIAWVTVPVRQDADGLMPDLSGIAVDGYSAIVYDRVQVLVRVVASAAAIEQLKAVATTDHDAVEPLSAKARARLVAAASRLGLTADWWPDRGYRSGGV